METGTLDIVRFNKKGERIRWRAFQAGASTQNAPFRIRGRFDEGEEVWFSKLIFADSVTLIEAHRPPEIDPGNGTMIPARKVFLLYPDEGSARRAGWKI